MKNFARIDLFNWLTQTETKSTGFHTHALSLSLSLTHTHSRTYSLSLSLSLSHPRTRSYIIRRLCVREKRKIYLFLPNGALLRETRLKQSFVHDKFAVMLGRRYLVVVDVVVLRWSMFGSNKMGKQVSFDFFSFLSHWSRSNHHTTPINKTKKLNRSWKKLRLWKTERRYFLCCNLHSIMMI